MIKIENFTGKEAKVFATSTRGEEILVGRLVRHENGVRFHWDGSVGGVRSWLRTTFWCSPEWAKVRDELNVEELEAEKAKAEGDFEFRQEVMNELIAEGKAAHVAANLTNTPQKLMAEAKRMGVI